MFDLTVEENLFMGKEITKGFGICDKKAMRAKAEEVLERMGVSITCRYCNVRPFGRPAADDRNMQGAAR